VRKIKDRAAHEQPSAQASRSAASVPLALAEACADGRVRQGDLVLLEALGGGLTWGSALVRM